MSERHDAGAAGTAAPAQEAVRPAPALEVSGLAKAYNGIPVLTDVDFAVGVGEIVGLVGENGAGKSTLLRSITGLATPDKGEVRVRGQRARYGSYYEANEDGVFQVFQELSFVPNLSIGENFFLRHEHRVTNVPWRERRAAIAHAGRLLDGFGYGHIDASRHADEFDVATRQLLEILKAFALTEVGGWENPLLLLDEPTASLRSDEVGLLYGLLEQVKERAGIVFISHRLTEVLDLCDRLVVLKDGAMVIDAPVGEMSEGRLHELMVGRERDRHFYREDRQRTTFGDERLAVSGMSSEPHFRDVSFAVHAGEIVGIGGLLGAGKSEVGRAIFGDLPRDGELRVDGETIKRPSVRDMVARKVGYVSPERSTEGILTGLSVAWNISIVGLRRGGFVVRSARERGDAERFIQRLRIRTRGTGQAADTLSGGNQQKTLLARWMACGSEILIVDNPTRGVDSGAKEEIYDVLREMAEAGAAIVVISDDLLELIGISSRVLVMKDGRVAIDAPCPPDTKPTEREIVAHMV